MPRVCVSAWRDVDDAAASNAAHRNVVALALALDRRGVAVQQFNDLVSVRQHTHEQTLADWHNSLRRDLDVAISCERSMERGCVKVCYHGPAQQELAAALSAAIAGGDGLVDCGAYESVEVPFLLGSHQPAFLIELPQDARGHWRAAAKVLADTLAAPPLEPRVTVELTVPDDVRLRLVINGEELLPD